MKLNNKGFSSKETLAVIIMICMLICAIVPTVLTMIKDSDNKVLLNNVAIFKNELNNTLLSYTNGGEVVEDGCYYIMKKGELCLGDYDKHTNKCTKNVLTVEVDGLKPNAGAVDIYNGLVEDIHNVKIKEYFVNIDKYAEFYLSEEPKTQGICRP